MKIKQILIMLAHLWPMLQGPSFAGDLSLISEPIRIAQARSRIFTFTAPSMDNGAILIDISARMNSNSFAGSSYLMKLMLNGKPLTPRKTRLLNRLSNKKLISPIAFNSSASWLGGDQAWRVLYGPDFDGALKIPYYEGNPYQTLLDVTDLVTPEGKNKLEIINLCKGGGSELVLSRLSILQNPMSSPMLLESAIGIDHDVINHGENTSQPAAYTGEVLPGGGFNLNVAGNQLEFASRISYPNGGFNLLSSTGNLPPGCQADYQVVVKKIKNGGQVFAQGPNYSVERTVTFTTRKVYVTDKITNLQKDAKLGIWYDNYINLKNKIANIRLAGNPDISLDSYYSPGNPSVYLAFKDTGIGMLCEDDVFRNQADLYFDAQTLTSGLRTRMLCLPAGGAYTLNWSVYPVASNDYYDFINMVRQDWGANYTVEGAWTFFSADDILQISESIIRENFLRLGIKYACSWGGWVDRSQDPKRLGFGADVFEDYWSSYRNRLKAASEKIHQAVPGCKVFVYFNTQRDTSEDGQSRFKDSWVKDRSGTQLSTVWGGLHNRAYNVVATTTNSFGISMRDIAGRYLSELKADGLYWDEIEGISFGEPLLTYAIYDGYSCILKKNNTIEREVGITTLLGETHRLAIINKMRALGGEIMGNGPICTKDLLALKSPRMVEVQHNDYWNYEGNLGSPLGYAGERTDFGNWIRALKMATLLVGTRFNYTYDIQPYIFPFTPIELHAGYLLGEERIIVTHDGNFGWSSKRNLVQVRHFGQNGKLTFRSYLTTVDKEARTKVELEENEAAILVKLPVEIAPVKHQVAVCDVKYGAKAVRFKTDVHNGLTLTIKTGEFAIRPGAQLSVRINKDRRVVKVNSQGILQTAIAPTSVKQDIEITPSEDSSLSSH